MENANDLYSPFLRLRCGCAQHDTISKKRELSKVLENIVIPSDANRRIEE